MKPRVLLAAILALSLLPLGAIDLARSEVESVSRESVAFINYEGPQSKIESVEAIVGIGTELGRAIGKPELGRTQAGLAARYSVQRIVDPAVATGFDADILLIGPEAQVDHIQNLRRIIAGYLRAAWGYSERDAGTLAVFVTVYNAVHRGDLAYFGAKYKPGVLKALPAASAGLSTRWDEWAGKSRIVIPLSSGAAPGSLGAVDTGAVSDRAVTESMRTEQGQGIGDRQAMVDLKEREAAEKQAEADRKKAEAAAAEAALAAERDRLAAERAALEADKAKAAAAAGTAPASGTSAPGGTQAAAATQPAATGAGTKPAAAPGGAAATETVAQPATAETTPTAEDLAARETALAAEEEALKAKEAEVAQKQEAAATAEAAAKAKADEAVADRAAVTEDQKAAIAEEVATKAQAEAAGIYLFEIVDAAYPFARVVFVNAETGTLIRASTVNSIRARTVLDGGDSFVAIAGKEGGTGAVRLVKLEKASLSQMGEGATDLFPESVLAKGGPGYFAVIKAPDGQCYLGGFGQDLKEAQRSTAAVNPYTFVMEESGGIVVQAASGGFLILDPKTLAVTKELGK